MFSTIQGRLKLILGTSMILVGLMGAVSLYYFAVISEDLELVIGTDIKWERSSQEFRRLYSDLKQNQNSYLTMSARKGDATKDIEAFQSVKETLARFEGAVQNHLGAKKAEIQDVVIAQLLRDLNINLATYSKVFSEYANAIKDDNSQLAATLRKRLGVEAKEIEEQIVRFRDHVAKRLAGHQEDMSRVLNNARRNIVLLISLSAIALVMIFFMAPQKVVQPIRTYINALRELRDLKFDVRLPTHSRTELSVLGKEINAFIDEFLEFDTMKVKKIQFEKRKLQVLSDILNLGVVVVSIEGDILFMNAQMAQFLGLSSEDFHKKDFHFVRLSEELKDLFEEALQKKEKFENRMMILPYKKVEDNGDTHEEAVELLVDAGMVRNYVGEVANIIFTFEDITNAPTDSIFKRISFKKKELV